MTNLATNLTTTAAKHPEQAALRVNGQGITYAQLHGMAAKLAGALRANGIQNVSQALYINALNFDRLLALGSS